MTLEHNRLMFELAYALRRQINPDEFGVRSNAGHVRLSSQAYYIPDVLVVSTDLQRRLEGTRLLETYSAPLPLVVEVWSVSTGDYDVETKLREYQLRGDLEIWRLHPYERSLISWQRQLDGSYLEQIHHGGLVRPVGLPGVVIDLDLLFG